MAEPSLLRDALVYLGAAVVCVPLAKRSGLGSVMGYLIAGWLIGPWGFKLIGAVESTVSERLPRPSSCGPLIGAAPSSSGQRLKAASGAGQPGSVAAFVVVMHGGLTAKQAQRVAGLHSTSSRRRSSTASAVCRRQPNATQ